MTIRTVNVLIGVSLALWLAIGVAALAVSLDGAPLPPAAWAVLGLAVLATATNVLFVKRWCSKVLETVAGMARELAAVRAALEPQRQAGRAVGRVRPAWAMPTMAEGNSEDTTGIAIDGTAAVAEKERMLAQVHQIQDRLNRKIEGNQG
jgi:hypothetical protein